MVAGRKLINGRLLVLISMATINAGIFAQHSAYDSVWTAEASQIREHVSCFTDRSVYIVGEVIHFRARVGIEGPDVPGPWSTVLYVELLSSDGQRLAGGKYPVNGQVSSGEFRIPGDLLTGRYYLRAYTRWMRNMGPESFSYLPLRIINPSRSELYRPSSGEADANLLPAQEDGMLHLEFEELPVSDSSRDSMMFDLLVLEDRLGDGASGCLSVVPLTSAPVSHGPRYRHAVEDFRINFLPDRYGPSLSGSVKYPDMPAGDIPPILIHFTLLGDTGTYLVCRSDSRGKFIVGLPMRSGPLEIFVQPGDTGDEGLQVLIDQDFDPRQINFPHADLNFTEQELQDITLMARKVQLSGIYMPVDTLKRGDSIRKAAPFYGTPTFTVDLDEYVLLPTLREVFLNLVPGVTPVSRRGKTSLVIESVNPSLSLYESMVMVDQVPVLNMDHFMSLSPAKIRKIDVVEDVFVKGDQRFGGIINLISRDRDMAGIDLPGNSFFIDYPGLQPASPGRRYIDAPEDRVPDMRNTLLWLPDLELIKGMSFRVSFRMPDYPGDYIIVFQGFTRDGQPLHIESIFKVP